jgi:hypothetical protein
LAFANSTVTLVKPGLTQNSEWVRPRRAREVVDIGVTKLYQLIKDGRVVSKRVDGMRLIHLPSLKNLT